MILSPGIPPVTEASRSDALDVWLYGVRVAELSRAAGGRLRLVPTPESLERWSINSPILGESLRLRCGPFPEEIARNVLDGALLAKPACPRLTPGAC